jgi:hypothetical protein
MDVPNGEPVRAEVIRPPASNLYDAPQQRKRFRILVPHAAFHRLCGVSAGEGGMRAR